jgi:hypothetical protein
MTTRSSRAARAFSPTLKHEGVAGEQPVGIPPAATDHDSLAAPANESDRQLVTLLHIQRGGGSQVMTVCTTELELLFHDGVLMPIDSIDRRGAKQ